MTGKSSQQRKALGASLPRLRFAVGAAPAGTMLITLRDCRDFILAYDVAGTISLHLDIKRSASDSLVFRQAMLVDELPINIGPAGMMLKEPLISSR